MASLTLGDQEGNLNVLDLHSKYDFKVEALKQKAGGKAVQGSSVPLILPNDLKYNASTGRVEKVQGERRETLQAVPEALALLEGIKEPLSVLAICGPCRSGKSYILSRLLGTADAFELGHRLDPKTFGIWMGTSVLRGKDFTIVLLDTEGIDAAGARANQDAGILVMTILLSSLLIYNSLNVPYKTDLEKMQCFINLAEAVSIKKAQKRKLLEYSEHFPDFMWLLRDVSLKPTDKNGKEISPTEYLKTRVLGKEEEEDEDLDESTSDKVRKAILTFFSSVECFILERPSEKAYIMNNIASHTSRLNPDFNKGVKELIERLLKLSHAKRGYEKGSTINGMALSIMTKQYVEAVNDPKAVPALDNTWKNTIQLMQKQGIRELVGEYNLQMEAAVSVATNNGTVPLDETIENGMESHDQPSLMDLHNQVFSLVTDMLLEKIGHFGVSSGNAVVAEMQNCLIQRKESVVEYKAGDDPKGVDVIGGELFRYIQRNKELSRTFCQDLFKILSQPIREHVDNPPPDYDFEQLMEELGKARQQYSEQARGPEKWVVLQERANIQLMEEQQKAHKAELEKMEKMEELQKLYNQAKNMEQDHREIMQKMNQQHMEQMEKMKQEAAKQGQYLHKVHVEEQAMFPDVVELNVGGTHFTTCLTTLRKYPESMLATMFSGRHRLARDKDGRYFIDRDGTYFKFVLDFLRTDEVPDIPPDCLMQAYNEAQFYGLKPLIVRLAKTPTLSVKNFDRTT
ncbi:Guanylate-binding protein 5 [Branchiostoma belcheri]|nr:Guanylate-binding protein 5 [Branchiostoma belcheri]